MRREASVIHLNVVNFPASAEALRDSSLREKAFAVAVPGAARALILDVSRNALKEGIEPGMRVDEAERRAPGLRLVPPSPSFYVEVNRAIEEICARYAPLLENAGRGHFYLDMGGTRSLFGAYLDTTAKIRDELAEKVGLDAATALAANKLVAKVGTRSLRPDGLVCVREGEEGSFLCHQDVGLLPGVEGKPARILETVGIREIGELAALSDNEVLGLLGRQGPALRDGARGIDGSPVQDGQLSARVIEHRIRFDSDVLDSDVLDAVLTILVERCGFELRRDKLAARTVWAELLYTDEVEGRGGVTSRRPLALDGELIGAARLALGRAHFRRVRVAEVALALSRLEPAGLQLDLFAPEATVSGPLASSLRDLPLGREASLQEAVDRSRRRYGCASLTHGVSLAAARQGDSRHGDARQGIAAFRDV